MPRKKEMIPIEVQEQMIRDNRRMPYQQVAKIYGYGRNKTYAVVRERAKRQVENGRCLIAEKKKRWQKIRHVFRIFFRGPPLSWCYVEVTT